MGEVRKEKRKQNTVKDIAGEEVEERGVEEKGFEKCWKREVLVVKEEREVERKIEEEKVEE